MIRVLAGRSDKRGDRKSRCLCLLGAHAQVCFAVYSLASFLAASTANPQMARLYVNADQTGRKEAVMFITTLSSLAWSLAHRRMRAWSSLYYQAQRGCVAVVWLFCHRAKKEPLTGTVEAAP